MIVAFVFFVLIFRIFYLQAIGSQNLQLRAVEQWTRMLPLTAKRGDIVDVNGNILATSTTTYDVYVRAKEIKYPTLVAGFLAEKLGLDYEKVLKKAQNTLISESLIKLQVDEKVAQSIIDKGLDGIYLSENVKRYYPYGKAMAQVLGFLTSDSVGQSGLESFYDDKLSGTDGKYLTQSDVRGVRLDDSLKYYVEPIDGLNLRLNIDVNIQVLLEEVLDQIIIDHNPKKASILVIDPETSKVLGLAISPSFDLNNIPRDNVKELMELTKNVAVTDVFEPGSTFKILTLSAALSENLTDENERFFCPGYRIIDGEKIKCWKTLGHGSQTLVEAVQNSCNCCFMDLGLRLGKEKLYKYLKSFGIGSKTSVDISGESGGILLDENLVKDVDLARISFGQTVAVSEIQLANAFCSIINGGVLNTPRVLSGYFDENNDIYQSTTIAKSYTVTKDVGEKIRYLLEQAVSKTGEMSFVEGYKIGGKTGTAQKYGEDGKIARGKYVSSFFGFLNQGEKPEYAVLICVDEPSSGAYYGSVVAKPYAKTIYEGIIKYKGILPAGEIKNSTYVVPQLCGMSVSQAVALLDKMGVYYEVDGEGESVISQFPYANSNVSSDSAIVIKLA